MSSPLNARVREIKDQAAQNLEKAKVKAMESTRETAQRLDHEARQRPWLFVGIAAAFTGLFAFFLGRKSKRKER